jgi:hypothetical protein
MFYAADNHYSRNTGVGFANTWYVLAFETRAARDEYVRTAAGMAARAILKSEVTRYATSGGREGPKPFSGEYFGIDTRLYQFDDNAPRGMLGEVRVINPHDCFSRLPRRVFG